MTSQFKMEFQAFMSKLNEQIDADQALGEAWEKIKALLERIEAPEGGAYGGLRDMILSHFDALSEACKPSISLMSDVAIENSGGQVGCVVMRIEPDAQEDSDFTLAEEASYPYVALDGKPFVSTELIGTILDCTRRGYVIDSMPVVCEDTELQEMPGQKLPRHPRRRERKAKKRQR